MRSWPARVLLFFNFTLVLGALAVAQQSAPQAPTFRAGVEIIDLDVSVLDKDRHPVLGLTAADFTVLVDGQPRPVVAFKAVDLAPPEFAPAAAWVREVGRDVSTNAQPIGRVVVILMDDGSLNQADGSRPVVDQWGILKMRELARTVLNELGPDDLAAVVYSENNHTAQTFTSDRRRLLAAIDNSVLMQGQTTIRGGLSRAADPQGNWRGSCACGLCSIHAIGKVAESLRSLPHQRKVIAYVSGGVVFSPSITDPGGPEGSCMIQRHEAVARAFRQASLANVAVHAIDPKGLNPEERMGSPAFWRLQYLKTVAEQTGGRWILNNNDPQRMIPAVLVESSSYYMLGIEQPLVKADGTFHPIRVRVNRPGLDVRTRAGFFASTENERQAAAAASESRDLNASIGAALPKADIPMDVNVTPILGADRKPAVALAVAIRPKTGESAQARTEAVELAVTAFNPENGTEVSSRRQRVNVVWNATDATSSGEYEVLSKMPLAPGRYELRIGMKGSDGRTASVYASAEVPNFSKADLSLSGLVLSTTPRPKVGGEAELGGLLPILPTARRAFKATDQVTGFLRIYEKGQAFSPVTVTTRIVDTMDNTRSTTTQRVESADYQFNVPLAGLPPGEYLLTVDAALEKNTAQRAVRFRIE
jgi:VWFA-related protein